MRLDHTHPGLTCTTLSTPSTLVEQGGSGLERGVDGASDLHAHGAHEVCPLCLARYAAAAECICVACEAPSCPDCAELMPGTESMLCYACPVPTKH